MNAPVSRSEPPGPFDLGVLGAPARLLRAARLYAVVLDGSGNPGPHQFLAGLPEGAAVFALAAPGVRFMLHEQGPPSPKPLIGNAAPDAAAIDAWYDALLGAPGMPHGDAGTEPLARGDCRAFAARACVTARQIVWLESAAPILRYPAAGGAEASPATTRLVLANQIRAEITADNDVQAIDTATLLGRVSPIQLGEAALPGVLGVLAHVEGFELRTPLHDRAHTPLFERLKAYAFASGFGFRQIALAGEWWRRQGPPFIAVEDKTGQPLALVCRGRRWHVVDPETLGETPVDAGLAAGLRPMGYMLYAPLPDKPSGRDIWLFSTYGVRGDIRRLLIASAA